MSAPALRPEVRRTYDLPPEEILGRVRASLVGKDCPCYGRASSRHIDLQICEEHRHTWSPTLNLEVDPIQGGGTELIGRFGPHPNVWTLTIFAYACFAVIFTAGTMLGLSQYIVGSSPTGLVGTAVGTVGIVCVYVAAGMGQRLGHDQMSTLLQFLEAAVDTPAPAEGEVS